MTYDAKRLQGKLNQILDILNHRSFFSFTPEESQSLKEEAKKLSQKLALIEGSFLTLGLLGGTGVGKSTLMNALAGSKIASTSHRRPHTEQVLVYRHLKASLPIALVSTDVPWREITHQANAIQQILLCDLPDFDSLMGEHREQVLHFLEHLDLLIWVTSPEKYADGRFYEFLRLVPKSRQNFFFVLNKMDLLFEGKTQESGYEQVASVTLHFQEHVKANGIYDPHPYVLSAQEAMDSGQLSPWNQFLVFRQQVFQQRDFKQIKAIKADNLDVEVKRLLSGLEKEVLSLETFEKILEDSIKDLEGQRSLWNQAGQTAIDLWVGTRIAQDTLSFQNDPTPLVGPGHSLAILFQQFKKSSSEEKVLRSELSSFVPPEEIAASFRRRLEWIEDRVNHRVLRQNLSSSFQKLLQEILDVQKSFGDLGERFSHVLALHIVNPALPNFRGFRAVQFLAYLVLFALFLLAIGGEAAWRQVFDDPGITNILRLLLSGVHTLFSSKGLAALLSYAMLNMFFAFRFYRRYRNLLKRMTQRIIESIKAGLAKVWEEELNSILDKLNQLRADIRSQISAISSLEQ